MLRWWKRNLTKGLGKFLKWTSSSKEMLNGTDKVRWDAVLWEYIWEDVSQRKHIKTMVGVKKDDDTLSVRDYIQRAIYCT